MTPQEKMFADAFVALNRAMIIEAFGTDRQKRELHASMEANRKKRTSRDS